MGTLHEDQYKFKIISRSVLFRMRNVSDKSCREKQATHFVFRNLIRKSYRLWIMWENIVEPGILQMTIWGMRIACRIPKATNTQSQYVIRIVYSLS
jgi:hypothetical protein